MLHHSELFLELQRIWFFLRRRWENLDKSCHVTSCQETMWTWKAKTNSFQCNMARVAAFCSLGRANLTHEMLLDARFSLHLATLKWVVQRLNAQVLSFWVKSEAHVLWNSGVWAIFPGHGCIFLIPALRKWHRQSAMQFFWTQQEHQKKGNKRETNNA